MYIPHKSQPAVPTTKPHIPPPSTFNPELMQSKLTMSLSITHIPVSIPTYRSCITCLTPISVFDAGDICTTCRLSLSAPINKNLQAPQSPSDANSPTKVAMSAFLVWIPDVCQPTAFSHTALRRMVRIMLNAGGACRARCFNWSTQLNLMSVPITELCHPQRSNHNPLFQISPTHQSIAGLSIPSKRRKVSHNPDPDENPGQSVDELVCRYFPTTHTIINRTPCTESNLRYVFNGRAQQCCCHGLSNSTKHSCGKIRRCRYT